MNPSKIFLEKIQGETMSYYGYHDGILSIGRKGLPRRCLIKQKTSSGTNNLDRVLEIYSFLINLKEGVLSCPLSKNDREYGEPSNYDLIARCIETAARTFAHPHELVHYDRNIVTSPILLDIEMEPRQMDLKQKESPSRVTVTMTEFARDLLNCTLQVNSTPLEKKAEGIYAAIGKLTVNEVKFRYDPKIGVYVPEKLHTR